LWPLPLLRLWASGGDQRHDSKNSFSVQRFGSATTRS
jgi:hypothetical protein